MQNDQGGVLYSVANNYVYDCGTKFDVHYIGKVFPPEKFLKTKPEYFAIIDGKEGREDKGFQLPAKAFEKGDAKSMSIAAASVLAKVARDRICIDLDREYPQYGIAKHKGYGTKAHMDALRKFGPSPIHRKTFLKFLDK